ncbi:MAG: hypothetical protein K1X57_04160 [Gemmataceae bacterium]|nr:hypothetical protein [Gemmataceae bacterium]
MAARLLYLFPMPREAGPFRRLFPREATAIIGMGGPCAKRIAGVIDSESPSAVILAGFAGSLQPTVRVGQVIVADRVFDMATGESWPATVRPRGYSSTVLCSPRAIGDSTEKRRLGVEYKADVVDMESAPFARICSERGVDWGVVRAVSDDVATDIPTDVLRLIGSGHVRWTAAMTALARRPGVARDFWRLARDSARAARVLAAALDPERIMST